MKTLNHLIRDYTTLLQHGEIQLAYKGILDFMGKLRADFQKKLPRTRNQRAIPGLHGHVVFFDLPPPLKGKGVENCSGLLA